MLPFLFAFLAQAGGQAAGCNAPPPATFELALPGKPFGIVTSSDGCWIFASLNGGKRGSIAVLHRAGGRLDLVRTVPLKTNPAGIAITHDGNMLVATANEQVVLLDVPSMTSGKGDPVIAAFSDGTSAGSVYANVTDDDKLLFISDEDAQSITVIDLAKVRAKGYWHDSVIGKIPVGIAPIALTFSKDQRLLYTTSEVAAPDWGWPSACKPEGDRNNNLHPEGAVIVIDVEKARTAPAKSVVARIPAGCSPVRLALSPDGERLYATARNSNAVLTFDTARLVSEPDHARIGSTPVGSAPVPIAIVNGGRLLVVGNSDRFAAKSEAQTLTLIDAAGAVAGTIPAGAFPRALTVSPDGKTLYLANFGSDSLWMINTAALGH